MKLNNIEVNILVGSKPIRQYGHEGKIFVLAKKDCEYSIRIRNSNSFRILAVVSVDGVDVLNGKEASEAGGGYIIHAFGSYEVTGFRKDLSTTGAFKFTDRDKSYAESTGHGGNAGVIAVCCWREKTAQLHDYYGDTHWWGRNYPNKLDPDTFGPTFRSCNSRPDGLSGDTTLYACSTKSSVQNQTPPFQAGTSWGSHKDSPVVEASFTKEDLPVARFEIFYDYAEGLRSMGVSTNPVHEIARTGSRECSHYHPNGFPAKFCTPPSNWDRETGMV